VLLVVWSLFQGLHLLWGLQTAHLVNLMCSLHSDGHCIIIIIIMLPNQAIASTPSVMVIAEASAKCSFGKTLQPWWWVP
jgi:hypothetical protein